MPRIFLPPLRVIIHLFFLLIYYTCFRALFLLFNYSLIRELEAIQFIGLFFHGWRFDISVILLINSLWILLVLFPYPIQGSYWQKKLLKFLFVLTNGIAFSFEASDWIYFQFNHKRATADILSMISRKGDFLTLLPDFLTNYWYILLLTISFIWIMSACYSFVERKWMSLASGYPTLETSKQKRTNSCWHLIVLVVCAACTLVGIRGGFQLVPINIRNAVEVTKPQYTAAVLNTPFSIVNSLQGDKLEELHFMPLQDALQLVNPIKQYKTTKPFQRKNVVFLILESFSKEFTKLGPGRSYTPFLDSLMDCSMTFTNAYANALHSNEGIPAIIAGLPGLIEEPVTTSVYSNNHYTSIPALLKKKAGYHTAFYHGCTNGSMSFDIFARSSGFDQYYGRTEYGNEKDYDGSWGIFDEPFMQYFARGLQKMKQPFATALFTATSHHPYPIPTADKNKFPKGTLAAHETTGYTDFALQRFFEKVKGESWFQNTLFIITADHCSPLASSDFYATGAGKYQIPILLFAPGDSSLKGYNPTLVQQIDILPTILDYMGYTDSFFALGNSAFDPSADRFVINRLSTVYEWINGGYRLKITDGTLLEAYQYPSDSLGKFNLVKKFPGMANSNKVIRLWEAVLQVYTDGMIHNKMHSEDFKRPPTP